jgi:hypothetical protein
VHQITNRLDQKGKCSFIYLSMVYFSDLNGEKLSYDQSFKTLCVKMGFRRQPFRDLRKSRLSAGELQPQCKKSTLCVKVTCGQRRIKISYNVLTIKIKISL